MSFYLLQIRDAFRIYLKTREERALNAEIFYTFSCRETYQSISLWQCECTFLFLKLVSLSLLCVSLFYYLQSLTCHGQNSEVPHPTDVLEAEVSDLRTPAEEERSQGQHGGDVAHPDVADVNTPVQCELLQVGQITSDVLQSRVSDPGTPGEVQADQFPQVLSNQLDTVVRDLAAAGERENGQIWQGVN